MPKLYNTHPETLEYLPGRDTEPRENKKFDPETHAKEDRYIYNRRTATLVPPPETGDNETARLVDGQWEVVSDYRGNEYWEKDSKARHVIAELGDEPDPNWADSEPLLYQRWDDAAGWVDDLDLWLDLVVRPTRGRKMAAFDWRVQRYNRETRLGLQPTDDVGQLDSYMQALADFPSTLTSIVNPVPWPEEPV